MKSPQFETGGNDNKNERGGKKCRLCKALATKTLYKKPLCDEHYGLIMNTAVLLKGQGKDTVTWKELVAAAEGSTNLA